MSRRRFGKQGARWASLGAAAAASIVFAVAGGAFAADSGPTIVSDQTDYSPGSVVTLTGSGWQDDTSVTLSVNDSIGSSWSWSDTVTPDANGGFVDTLTLPDWFVASYAVTATGITSGMVATASFTDTATVDIDNKSPNDNARPWFRTVAGGFDVTLSGTYTCSTSGSGTNKCASPIDVKVDVFPSNGAAGVSGTSLGTKTVTGLSGGAWTTTYQFRASPGAGQFPIPADRRYDVRAVLDYNVSPSGTASSTNTSDDHFGVDNTPPTSAVTSVTQGSPLTAGGTANDATSGLGSGNPKPLHVEIRVGTSSGSVVANTGSDLNVTGQGTWSYSTASFPTAPGTYCVVSQATDIAGNVQTSVGSSCFTVAPPDTTAPTLSFSQTPDGNNGWFRSSPATLTVTATDADDNVSRIDCTIDGTATSLSATSGIGSSTTASGVVSTASQGDHTVSCTATDSHANTTSPAQTAHLKLDTVAPSLSGSAAPAANANGWNTGDVSVHWTCSDATSDIAGSCPADSTLTGEGSNLSANASVSDNAGNSTNASVSGINIDRTAPTISVSHTPDGNNGWNTTSPVALTITAGDGLSGLAGAPICTVDGDPLAVTGTSSPYGADVFGEGTHAVSCSVSDNAGNDSSSGGGDTVKIDTVAPTVIGSPTTSPNANGWYRADVSIHWTCGDDTSGLAAGCPSDSTITAEGKDLTVSSGAVEDEAGNSTTADSEKVSIDKTAPDVSCTVPDQTAWYADDVTVHCNASDGLSDLASPSDASFDLATSVPSDTETSSASTDSKTVSDAAGNETTRGPFTFEVDKKAPVITDGGPTTSPTGSDGTLDWYDHDVTDTFSATDGGSGLKSPCSASWTGTTSGDGRGITVSSGSCSDEVGNTNAGIQSAGFNVDEGKPNAPTAAATTASDYTENGHDWWKDSVTVAFTANGDPDLGDGSAGSGVDLASVTANTTFTTPGEHTAGGTVQDHAGNTSAAGTLDVYVDSSKPEVTLTCPNGVLLLNAAVTAGWSATDTGSGVASGYGVGSIAVDTSSVGPHSAQVAAGASKDNVGHGSDASSSCNYVVTYAFSGFLSPLSSNPADTNTGNAGRTYPIKWQLTDANGAYVTTAVPSTTIAVSKINCQSIANDTGNPIDYTSSGNTMLRYDSTANQYVYNWATPSTKSSCYRLTVTTPDGQPHVALFSLR